ncbi:ecdysone 20-monooxygenase isoform X2 [Ixodes scapularis]
MKQGARVLARSVGSETPSIIALGHAEATPAAKQAQQRVVTPLADARTYPKPFHQIPGPKPSLPLIGTSWQYFRWGRYSLYQLHEACADKYRRYGDVMKEEYQWQVPIVHAFNPEDFETIFRHQGRCPIRPANEFVRKYRTEHPHKYSNVGLSNALGEEWHTLRTALAPVLLQMRSVPGLAAQQSEICEDFVSYVRFVRNGKSQAVDNIQDSLYRLALECGVSRDITSNDRVPAKTRRRCRALYDCCADQRDELSFAEGEIIVIISEITEDDQWMEGMIEGEPHRRGVFPTSFVHMLSD